jgi:hypothetical protein
MNILPVPGSPVIKQPLSSSILNSSICASSIGLGIVQGFRCSCSLGFVLMHLANSVVLVSLIPQYCGRLNKLYLQYSKYLTTLP